MFEHKRNVRATLMYGPQQWSKSFVFEAAIYFAEEGRRVIYVTPTPIESLPRICHGRNSPTPAAFKLMRFMYLENHQTLVKHLAELHTFASLPSVLLIDDFDAYVNDSSPDESSRNLHIAATSAFLLDTMNVCARLLKTHTHLLVWSNSISANIHAYTVYFRNIWGVKEEDSGKTLLLEKLTSKPPSKACPLFIYTVHNSGTRSLKEIRYVKEKNEQGD